MRPAGQPGVFSDDPTNAVGAETSGRTINQELKDGRMVPKN
jgi:hypothetical protein